MQLFSSDYRMLKKLVLMLHRTNNKDATTVISLIHSMMFSMQSLRFLLRINCRCNRMDFLVSVSILLRRLRSRRFIFYFFLCLFANERASTLLLNPHLFNAKANLVGFDLVPMSPRIPPNLAAKLILLGLVPLRNGAFKLLLVVLLK